jgi:TRIAD3 protein (E3 ubiquitin-protein ligase RNF216)
MAEKLNAEIAMEEGGLIECSCCYDETPFENIVQCSEGHLFCKQCLQVRRKTVPSPCDMWVW